MLSPSYVGTYTVQRAPDDINHPTPTPNRISRVSWIQV